MSTRDQIDDTSTEARLLTELDSLRRRVRRLQRTMVVAGVGVVAALTLGLAPPTAEPPVESAGPASTTVLDEVRTRRLVVVDEAGTPRVVIAEEAVDANRRARAAGILLIDRHGTERGGLVTFDDDSVILALDAPAGVGAPMRDRAAMQVFPNGAAAIKLIDNQTAVPVRFVTDADGGGGLELLDYDLPNRSYTVRRIAGDGESTRELTLGGG